MNCANHPETRADERPAGMAKPELYTLSLHDALPICWFMRSGRGYRNGPNRTNEIAEKGRNRNELRQSSGNESGRAASRNGQARALHSVPTRRSSDLLVYEIRSRLQEWSEQDERNSREGKEQK